jgi:hypothetical protein
VRYYQRSSADAQALTVYRRFLVERIISLNSFGCPLSSRRNYLRIMGRNATQKTNKENQFHSSGVWPMASYINHGCYSNARRSFIGDMMMVRATQDLAPNTEVTHWYQRPIAATGYDERQKKFQPWGFRCDCAMCQDEQTTKKSVLAKRKRLRADFEKYAQPGAAADIIKMESTLAAITDTYRRPASEVPRESLWDLHLALTRRYARKNQPAKAIDSALSVLASLGYVIEGGSLPRTSGTPMVVKQWGLMEDCLIECWLHLSSAYHLVAPDLEPQAMQYARISYRICIGEDETFDETYGDSI